MTYFVAITTPVLRYTNQNLPRLWLKMLLGHTCNFCMFLKNEFRFFGKQPHVRKIFEENHKFLATFTVEVFKEFFVVVIFFKGRFSSIFVGRAKFSTKKDM